MSSFTDPRPPTPDPCFLRDAALDIFRHALAAVDPAEAVHRAVVRDIDRLQVHDRAYDLSRGGRVFVVGTGKAGALMAQAVEEVMGDRLTGGVVNVKDGHVAPVRRVSLNEAGHPLPDEAGVRGAREIVRLLSGLEPDDLVFCVISGGGSALLPLPVDGITLAEKQTVTQLLLDCGATIHEINAVRKHISRVKGGQLARLAAPASVISLILSDVIGDRLDVIASGPTVPDTSTFVDCQRIIDRYDLRARLPAAVAAHLDAGLAGHIPETPKPGDPVFDRVQNVLVATNLLALRAAQERAEALGLRTIILSSGLEGETREVATVYSAMAKEIRSSGNPIPPPACVIAGGETTVTIRGTGKGGRNQEFVLAAARGIAGLDGVVVFSAGTDGTDGPTDAAGAVADGTTIRRAAAHGLDAERMLAANDSYHFFQPLGDLVITGPTQTNVMDLRLLLVG
ncbi:MAG: glycerate kinase [Candidatus Latescibacteria bacterium]|nr:glycerate kinase [Candidatus Latescibacterota bacterium]